MTCLNRVTLDSAHAWAKRDDVRRYATGHRYSPARRAEVKIPLELDAEAAQILRGPENVTEPIAPATMLALLIERSHEAGRGWAGDALPAAQILPGLAEADRDRAGGLEVDELLLAQAFPGGWEQQPLTAA